jgi:hypothetical protein
VCERAQKRGAQRRGKRNGQHCGRDAEHSHSAATKGRHKTPGRAFRIDCGILDLEACVGDVVEAAPWISFQAPT